MKKLLIVLSLVFIKNIYAQTQPFIFSIFDRIVYSSTNVGTSSWVEVSSATPFVVKTITIFDSSGQTMEVGTGSSGHEVAQFLVGAGGGAYPAQISQGVRVVYRAVSGTANTGEADINLFNQ